MHDDIDVLVLGKKVEEVVIVSKISLNRGTSVKSSTMSVLKVIEDEVRLVLLTEEFEHVAADIAGTADDEDH